jgi:hypothetical protein
MESPERVECATVGANLIDRLIAGEGNELRNDVLLPAFD